MYASWLYQKGVIIAVSELSPSPRKNYSWTPCKLTVVVADIAQERSHGIFCRTNYAPVPRVRYCAQAQLASKAASVAAASKTSISLL